MDARTGTNQPRSGGAGTQRDELGEDPACRFRMKESRRHALWIRYAEIDLPQSLRPKARGFLGDVVARITPMVQAGAESLQILVRSGFGHDGDEDLDLGLAPAHLDHIVVRAFRRKVGAVR